MADELVNKKVNTFLESIKLSSDVSSIRLMGWFAIRWTYWLWAIVNIVSNLSIAYSMLFQADRIAKFDMIGFAGICSLTGAIALAKMGQSFAENMQPKKEGQ